MKLFFKILILFSGKLFAQSNNNGELPAQYPGGIKALVEFIGKNKKNPSSVPKGDDHLKVRTRFVIDTSGILTDFSIEKTSGNKDIDGEALRLLKLMPKWEPAKQNGTKVKSYFHLPFGFEVTTKSYEMSRSLRAQFSEGLEKGNKMFDEKNYASAKEGYLTAFKANSLNDDVIYNLADSYLQINKKDSACYYWNIMHTTLISSRAKETLSKNCN